MKKFDLQQTIDNLPAGLDRAILRALSFHKGRQNTISRTDLIYRLKDLGFNYIRIIRDPETGKKKKILNDRPVRAQINQMRKDGYLIGAAAGEGGGYYMIISREEFEEFIQTEFRSKIIDMSETVRAMERQADQEFGSGFQPSLFNL